MTAPLFAAPGWNPLMLGNVQVRKVSVRRVNGATDTEVQENGRTIKIHDEPQKGLRVELTTTKNGKQATETFQAKDAQNSRRNIPRHTSSINNTSSRSRRSFSFPSR